MKVCNWDKWQSFRKDRGAPPWIKVHRNLLTNEQWVELSDSEKGQLVSIWMLAADKDGIIPDSDKMIQRMAMLENKPNIKKFIDLGFLSTTCQPLDNQENNPCPQLDAPEESRGEESRGDQSIKEYDQSEIDLVDYEYCFNLFWESGIRKVNKKKTYPIFIKLLKKLCDPCNLTIYDFTGNLCKDVEARINANQLGFAEMHPTTYLNGERWTDEIKEAQNENRPAHQQNRISTSEQHTIRARESYQQTLREIAELEAQGADENGLANLG